LESTKLTNKKDLTMHTLTEDLASTVVHFLSVQSHVTLMRTSTSMYHFFDKEPLWQNHLKRDYPISSKLDIHPKDTPGKAIYQSLYQLQHPEKNRLREAFILHTILEALDIDHKYTFHASINYSDRQNWPELIQNIAGIQINPQQIKNFIHQKIAESIPLFEETFTKNIVETTFDDNFLQLAAVINCLDASETGMIHDYFSGHSSILPDIHILIGDICEKVRQKDNNVVRKNAKPPVLSEAVADTLINDLMHIKKHADNLIRILFLAFQLRLNNLLIMILEKQPAIIDYDFSEYYHCSVLHMAILTSNVEMVHYLVSKGADIHKNRFLAVSNWSSGTTYTVDALCISPLYICILMMEMADESPVLKDQLEQAKLILHFLLEQGADPNQSCRTADILHDKKLEGTYQRTTPASRASGTAAVIMDEFLNEQTCILR